MPRIHYATDEWNWAAADRTVALAKIFLEQRYEPDDPAVHTRLVDLVNLQRGALLAIAIRVPYFQSPYFTAAPQTDRAPKLASFYRSRCAINARLAVGKQLGGITGLAKMRSSGRFTVQG
jgi:hypothetical protein